MKRTSPSRALRITATVGAALVGIVSGHAAGVLTLALMLGPAVVVPLGLALVLDDDPPPVPARAVTYAAPLGALAGVLGWLAPPGHVIAIAASMVHAVVCFLAGTIGFARLYHRRHDRFGPLHEIAFDTALLLIPVGGVWLVAARAGASLAGFHEPVVTLTAAHFHFAGFAAPIIIGGVGRLLRGATRGQPVFRMLYRVAVVSVCAGVPLTAIGILTSPTIEAVSAVVLASGMLTASMVLVFAASRQAAAQSRIAAALFVISGATLLVTMSLAATFAVTSSAGRGSSLHGAIPLQTMIDWHGGANAIGFSMAGLLALTLLAITPPQPPPSPPSRD